MTKVPVVWKNFEGGWAVDNKVGLKNSFGYSEKLDFRKAPSQMTILPGTTREDTGVVNDLIQNEVMVDDGTIYAIGSSGGFYKRSTSAVWSQVAGINIGTYGIDYRKDTDSIYIPTRKSVSVYLGVSGTPAMYMNFYTASYSQLDNSSLIGFNVKASQSGSSLTTQPQTTITEFNTARRYFQSDIEPLTKISVFVVGKGTGDWTLTLHDGNNKVLATSTVTNANLTNGIFNDFSFTNATNGQVRIYVQPNARTYHFHLTSTVADGTISSTVTNDLSSCDCKIWADRLIQTNNGVHPMTRFQQYECIGNGNYLSIWEPLNSTDTTTMTSTGVTGAAEWQQHKLTFPQEYEVCGLAIQNEFLVIACERVTTNTSFRPQDGILFYWDGLSNTYNYFVRVPEGSPQGIHEYKNDIYYYAGGAWYGISGPTTQPIKLRTLPGSDTEFSGSNTMIRVNPYAATIRRGVHLMAYPCMTTNTSINFGVYSYGAVDKNFPNSFGLSYLLSTGNKNYSASNNLQIGMVKNFGDTLHISWQDSSVTGGYGIDVVDNTSSPFVTATWESLIFDNGMVSKEKKGIYMLISYLTLPSGATVTPKYKLDRGSWVSGSAYSSTVLYQGNTNYCRLDIANPSVFLEAQVGFDLTATTTTPTITSVSLIFDDGREEGFS